MIVVYLLVALALVFAIAAVVVGREARRLDAEPPRPVFDPDEAVEWVANHLPFEVSAVLSHDDGATWETGREIQVRDDAIGSVGYPMSVHLADGTIFTACELGKPVRGGQEREESTSRRSVAGPEDVRPTATGVIPGMSRDIRAIDMEARPQAYVAGSRYTEDYVAPLGRR